ncbi:unnamed protein product [Calypogeia fissa]
MPNFVAAPNISNESVRAVPTRSFNRRQKEDIDRHLQRLAMAAAAAEAAAAGTVNLGTSPSFNDRIIGGYQETVIGGTFASDTFTFSNLSATQGDTSPENGHFWTRNKFPVSPTPITAPRTTSNHLSSTQVPWKWGLLHTCTEDDFPASPGSMATTKGWP